MQIQTVFDGKEPFQMQLGFDDFLYSDLMRRQSKVAMCEPEDLIKDYLPPFDWSDDDELSEAFSEVWEGAANYQADKVRRDSDDLAFIRRHFARPEKLRLISPELLPAV